MLLAFDDESSREQFIRKAAAERPDIRHCLKPARTLPHVVASGLSGEQEEWVKRNLSGSGRAFADVQFEPFQP